MPNWLKEHGIGRRGAPVRIPDLPGEAGRYGSTEVARIGGFARIARHAARLLGVGLLVAASGQNAETAMLPEAELFPGAEIVTENQLSTMRGGFSVPSLPGLSFNFGVSVSTIFTAPDLPDMPTVTVETNLYFDSGNDANVSSTTNYTTTQGTQTIHSTDLTSINLKDNSFSTTNILSIQGQNLIVDSSSSTAGSPNSLSPPDADGNLVLVNSFSSDLIASIISNTLSGIYINQTTTIDVDVEGHANFVKQLPNGATLDALRSLNHSVIMGLSN